VIGKRRNNRATTQLRFIGNETIGWTMVGNMLANLMAALMAALAIFAVFYLFGAPKPRPVAVLAALPRYERTADANAYAGRTVQAFNQLPASAPD
jgi:hypothetical protein